MSISVINQLVRQCFNAYENKDRAAIESVLAPDFTFSSPVDDNIGREAYFERCWPNSEHIGKFELEPVLVEGDKAVVRYVGTAVDGSRFRNVEVFTIAGGKVRHVEVFFGADTAESVDGEEIRSVVAAWAEAVARKDVDGVLAHFTKDPVNFFMAPPLVADDPLGENLRDWFATFEGPLGHSVQQLRVSGGGSCAWAHGLIHLTGRKVEGEETDLWYRLTLGLVKEEAAWRIAHAHESVPFLMDGSERAATGLKPGGGEG
ncbi:nuclear transport factor 2 family protein [Luteolibacter yonseiensis]|uniref:Nuclear transport factor 2 family protein n=1 Tax=Luteolibacter yonseiensis TaxID=1144680 RepID=A0A934V5K9_9BACT|nr:nuclear transport factor 2 family protein [Luteolibacter yonseiensis]MBK1814057.1 nuclear transport factor 2 family protein [Luteolibacter yonseiensis]